jgi:hypothetical protein
MKKAILKKTSGFLAALMLLTLLVPVLASAAIKFSSNITYSTNGTNGTIAGTVYFDINEAPTSTVYLDVYNWTNSATQKVYAQEVSRNAYSVYYSFSQNVGVYNQVYLGYGGVSKAYIPTFAGGGGFAPAPTPSTGTNVNLGNATSISIAQLTSLLAAGDAVTLTITGETLSLPASALATNGEAVVTISNGTASIALPVEALDLEALAKELGVALADLNIVVSLNVLSTEEAAETVAAAEEIGAEVIAPVVDFTITATGPNGVSQEITSFGDTFVNKTITATNAIEPATSTGVLFDPAASEFSFIPTTFADKVATLKSNHNSIYTVLGVDNEQFADVPASHWAAEDIQLLSNKLIVAGVSETQFQPTRSITRAEFAALVVRSLGLATNVEAEGEGFSDVVDSAWYAEEVAAASNAGLIAGYPDGTFRPNQTITRAELASLVVRALAYAGEEVELTSTEQADILADFADADQIGTWATNELAVAVQAGIVLGVGADMIAPNKTATRAEATAMLARYLKEAGFINE